jgi:hypothetical protein
MASARAGLGVQRQLAVSLEAENNCPQSEHADQRRFRMPDDFEYVSHARLEYRDGYRNAYLGEVPEPVVYGVQGALRQYYGAKEGPPIASTLDHIVAAVAG